ncbi:cyclic-phosphate processing receiver domain-containing protein [Lysobacter sp. TAB13]|uniref:cyclic-phosphate processing receiver domain-containing protein n=1 Tax=Lysobacter sp. TAB13 TaxID=3233065 RepID=UPI003F9AE9F4
MRVYLDDERVTPPGWRRVYWPHEAIALLETGEVAELSLDHDLGDDARGTGYDVIVWIERAVIERGFVPPRIAVHSANPAARMRMLAGIEAVERAAGLRATSGPARNGE